MTLSDCVFPSFQLTKNAEPNKYRCSGYGVGFDARSQFSLSIDEWGKNIVFGMDNSLSRHIDNEK